MLARLRSSLPLLASLTLGLVAASAASAATPSAEPAPRERLSFNDGWRFHKGDPMWIQPHLDYEAIRPWYLASSAGLRSPTSPRPARPPGDLATHIDYVLSDYDDSGWRQLSLPHDWGIEGPFQQDLPGATGKLPWVGIGWYRKKFDLPATDAGRRLVLEIDGAMSYSLVWLNDQFVGGWPHGYTSYQLDLTPYAKPGEENTLVIRLDNPPESSRWYPGGGIYRNVWLTKTAPVHVAQWGVFVTTPVVSPDSAVVSIQVQTDNETGKLVNLTQRNEIYALDAQGRKTGAPVATGKDIDFHVPSHRQSHRTHEIVVKQPRLWDVYSPDRYVAVTTLLRDGKPVDRVETPFGIRGIAIDAARGFVLNGKPLRLQGVCMHSDLGALGVAINTRAIERQLEILRDMGVNAVRTSHNPHAPEFLDACDRLGILVVNEAFDHWQKGKNRNDYHRLFADWHEADLRAFIRRDRNHPSVIMWSLGNEVIEQWRDDGVMAWQLGAALHGIAKQEDRTRPTTGAFNNPVTGFNGFQHAFDVFGYNYQIGSYASFREAFPAQPLYGSETASTLSSRGEYFFPVSDVKTDPVSRSNFQVSSYDLFSAPWATTPEEEWRAGDAVSGYAGEFVWTGFDYLGEPTPYNNDATNLLNFSDPAAAAKMAKQLDELGKIPVPSRSSYFGIVDLAGFPKDRFYLYQSRWRPDHAMAHILPHWTWPGREGEITPVHIYTSGDEAELFLNGKSLGRKKKAPGQFRLRWDDVKYTPGEVRVVAYKDGKRWAEAAQKTAAAPAKLAATADRATLRADGSDLAFITVSVRDADGVLAPRADNFLQFTLEGPGEIIATDNGDPTSFEPFTAPRRRAFNGLALVVVRTRAGEAGKLVLRADSYGLAPATVTLESR